MGHLFLLFHEPTSVVLAEDLYSWSSTTSCGHTGVMSWSH
jgi:hypothetical protein